MNKRSIVFLSSVCGALVMSAAQFQPVGGGNLDDPENWNGQMTTLAVSKQLTGPLKIKTSPASMPEGATSLCFYNFTNTCEFGENWILDLGTVPLQVEHGGGMILKSGKIIGKVYVQDSFNSQTQYEPGTLILDGADAIVEPTDFAIRTYQCTTSPKANRLVVTNGAKLAMSGFTFNMCGGFNAGYALFTGEGSSLQAKDLYMGARAGTATGSFRGYEDKPGVQRTVEFADGATGSISGSLFVGDVSGGNTFKVSSGATFTVDRAVYFGPDKNDGGVYDGCTNNSIVVDGGTLNVFADILTGRKPAFHSTRIEVTNGGRLAITDPADGRALQLGVAADGDELLVAGENSVLSLPKAKFFVGGRGAACNGNLATVKDGGRIVTGADAYLGLVHGVDNRLELSNGATFESTADFYLNGPSSVLKVSGSTFTAVNVYSDVAATNSAIIVSGPDTVFSANNMRLKTKTLFVADGVVLGVPRLAFAKGSLVTLTNSTMTLTADVLNGGGFGSTDSSFELHDQSVLTVNYRWVMGGTNFTVRVDDSTLDASGIKSDWFITGVSAYDGERHFIFEGARPYLKTASNGFYLRGTAIDLTFNLGEAGFPTDRPVVDVQGSGKFATDTNGKSANLVSVNVSGDCPAGTYVLMRGTDAGKFLNADRYALTCGEGRKASLIRTDNEVSVQVKEITGLMLIVK